MRKLVTIREINEILPIEGADLIVLVRIDGWQCVAKKEEFEVGDYCVYFEIDSFLPLLPQYEHLRARCYKKMGDKEGLRIKTIKLRGQLSQGMVLPIGNYLPDEVIDALANDPKDVLFSKDFTTALGVQLYEQPVPAQIAGQVRGNFPSFIKKTDQERCQNLGYDIFTLNSDSKYEVTMKLDGTSFTAYHNDGNVGVCGRNWELKVDESNDTNTLVRMFIDSGLQTVLPAFGKNYAIQGELMGPNIQANREGLKTHKLFVFDIFDIDLGMYLPPDVRHEVLGQMMVLGLNKNLIEHVPIIAYSANLLDTLGIQNVGQLLQFAEGPSIVHPVREGLVFKRVDGLFSFKAISNAYLLKEKD